MGNRIGEPRLVEKRDGGNNSVWEVDAEAKGRHFIGVGNSAKSAIANVEAQIEHHRKFRRLPREEQLRILRLSPLGTQDARLAIRLLIELLAPGQLEHVTLGQSLKHYLDVA